MQTKKQPLTSGCLFTNQLRQPSLTSSCVIIGHSNFLSYIAFSHLGKTNIHFLNYTCIISNWAVHIIAILRELMSCIWQSNKSNDAADRNAGTKLTYVYYNYILYNVQCLLIFSFIIHNIQVQWRKIDVTFSSILWCINTILSIINIT